MGSSRFRIQAFDRKGNRFAVSFEGRVSRDKVLQVLDMVELLGGLPSEKAVDLDQAGAEPLTKLERVKSTILDAFATGWFSSKDLQASYEEAYGVPLALSTASTYLQRLAFEGFLLRSGSRAARRYRLNISPEKGLLHDRQKGVTSSSAQRP